MGNVCDFETKMLVVEQVVSIPLEQWTHKKHFHGHEFTTRSPKGASIMLSISDTYREEMVCGEMQCKHLRRVILQVDSDYVVDHSHPAKNSYCGKAESPHVVTPLELLYSRLVSHHNPPSPRDTQSADKRVLDKF